jgi:hypothetical protein
MTTLLCDDEFALSDQLQSSRSLRREGPGVVTLASEFSWHRWALDELENINRLSEGWDGDQAPRPDRLMVASACGFVDFLGNYIIGIPSPCISLSPNSTIVFSWKQGERTIDMEFKNSDTVAYYFKNRATKEKRPGILRHNKFDEYILSRLKELADSDFCEHAYTTAR